MPMGADRVGELEETRLGHAAEHGHLAAVRTQIDSGADVDEADAYGSVPLHLAAWQGRAPIVQLLLSAGAKAARCDTSGRTPLHLAAWYGHAAVVEMLLAKGADANCRNAAGRTPLQYAARYGRLDAVKVLCAHGAARGGKEVRSARSHGHAATAAWLAENQGLKLSIARRLLGSGTGRRRGAAKRSTPRANEVADPTQAAQQSSAALDRARQVVLLGA